MFKEVITMFFLNLLLMILLLTVNYKDLKKDFKKINRTRIFFCLIIFTLLVLGLYFFNEFILNVLKIDTTENQEKIIHMIKDGSCFLMFCSTVIFAPIYEELLFRNLLGKVIKNNFIFILASTICFSLIHVSSNLMDIVPYLFYSSTLSVIFILFKRNIYSTIGFHFLNNLIAFIIILL